MKNCKTPGAQFHIRIGPRIVSCQVDIPFDLDLTKAKAITLENKIHDALESVLQEYWVHETEFDLSFNETFKELLERKLEEQKNENT